MSIQLDATMYKFIVGGIDNADSFKYLGSNLTNDGRCTCEIKCRIAMAKAFY
jgi:hypothetical protein